jgi:hypothetical protein
MVHDHYLDHQPKRGTNIVSWILLAIFISFFVGFFVHGAIGRALVQPLGAGAPMKNALPTDGVESANRCGDQGTCRFG